MAHSNTTGPNYYRRGNIQTWDFIRDQGLNFHLGNAVKYICRAGSIRSVEGRRPNAKQSTTFTNELENTLIQAAVQAATGKGIQEEFPGEEQYYASFTDYAEAFDR
jgi:hypothetical protein